MKVAGQFHLFAYVKFGNIWLQILPAAPNTATLVILMLVNKKDHVRDSLLDCIKLI